VQFYQIQSYFAGRQKSRTESLVNVILTSMATDMRRAACSVSPSPKRLSRKTSHESNSGNLLDALIISTKKIFLLYWHFYVSYIFFRITGFQALRICVFYQQPKQRNNIYKH